VASGQQVIFFELVAPSQPAQSFCTLFYSPTELQSAGEIFF